MQKPIIFVTIFIFIMAGVGLCILSKREARLPAPAYPVATSTALKPLVDCKEQLESASLIMKAPETRRDYGIGASPRWSWDDLPMRNGVYQSNSRDIYFEWEFPDETVSRDCTFNAGWVLMRSKNPDPIFDDRLSQNRDLWTKNYGKYTWDFPAYLTPGTWYFRACYGTYDPVGCSIYSNVIKVRIP